jgi:sRNA-binding carbon storage regulator CsrA
LHCEGLIIPVITRQIGASVLIGGDVKITIVGIRHDSTVLLGIDCPRDASIERVAALSSADSFDEESSPAEKFKIIIEAYATTTTDPDETGRQLVRLYQHLDEYCRLKYGRGLTLEEFEQRIKIGAVVPVGGGQ